MADNEPGLNSWVSIVVSPGGYAECAFHRTKTAATEVLPREGETVYYAEIKTSCRRTPPSFSWEGR